MRAVAATIHMAAESRRAATLNGAHEAVLMRQ